MSFSSVELRRRRKERGAFLWSVLGSEGFLTRGDSLLDLETMQMLGPSPSSSFMLIVFFILLGYSPLERHLRTAHPENEYGVVAGFWEHEVCGTWPRAKVVSYGWWNAAWINHFRMEERTFRFLV